MTIASSRAIVALAALVVVSGCSGSKTQQSSSASATAPAAARGPAAVITNPCKLVTQAEVSAAMGVKLGPGEFHAIVGGRCNFYSADSQKEVFLQVTDPALLDSFAHVGGVPVTGIGDKAIWLDGSVYVQKDGNVMQIGFSLPGPLKTMSPDAEKLAKIVASRM